MLFGKINGSNATESVQSDHTVHVHTLPVVSAIGQWPHPQRSAAVQRTSQQAAAKKWLPGTVATVCGWGGQTYNFLMSSFFRIQCAENNKNGFIFDGFIQKINMWAFFATQCSLASHDVANAQCCSIQTSVWNHHPTPTGSKLTLNISFYAILYRILAMILTALLAFYIGPQSAPNYWRLWLRSRPNWGAYSTPQTPSWV